MESKRMKKEDRMSDLPDHIIHHILSFLPSTKQAIQTGILSKRWKDQWTRVPVLIFDFFDKYPNSDIHDIPHELISDFSSLINNTLVLHECSKLKKFRLHYPSRDKNDPQLAAKIRFATSKDVEDLFLHNTDTHECYILPEFLFDYVSLVKLKIKTCRFMPNGKVNWRCLTTLNLDYCYFHDRAVEHILSGSPLLQSLKLKDNMFKVKKLVVASKSLKRFMLRDAGDFSVLKVSCPKLEVLYFGGVGLDDEKTYPLVIEKVLSVSLLLESLELIDCEWFGDLVIASKSLKKLVLAHPTTSCGIEILCPKLAKLKLISYMDVRYAKLQNFSSSLCATLDFHHREERRKVDKYLYT